MYHPISTYGVTMQEDLKWNLHVETQTKKANKRMYSVRRLYNKLQIDNKILSLFYNSIVSSVLTYAITSWFDACDKNLLKKQSANSMAKCVK